VAIVAAPWYHHPASSEACSSPTAHWADGFYVDSGWPLEDRVRAYYVEVGDMAAGKFLRRSYPPCTTCACRRPIWLPWRRFSFGAVWQCGRCGQQWEYRMPRRDSDLRHHPMVAEQAQWVRLEPHEFLPGESAGEELPALWRNILTARSEEVP
jgi:hypothetical protein